MGVLSVERFFNQNEPDGRKGNLRNVHRFISLPSGYEVDDKTNMDAKFKDTVRVFCDASCACVWIREEKLLSKITQKSMLPLTTQSSLGAKPSRRLTPLPT